jgi:hypothetical protein
LSTPNPYRKAINSIIEMRVFRVTIWKNIW